MLDVTKVQADDATKKDATGKSGERANLLPMWVAPTLEDVSEQVMAQPYIRFT